MDQNENTTLWQPFESSLEALSISTIIMTSIFKMDKQSSAEALAKKRPLQSSIHLSHPEGWLVENPKKRPP